MHQKSLIKKLKNGNPAVQKELYDNFSPKFMGICMRYLKDVQKAEDVLMEGFMKIFQEIKNYRDIGSFEGWMYRIMVNQCLMEIRKNHNFNIHLNPVIHESSTYLNALDHLYQEDLLNLINQLPEGCKTVFNLFVIEGYSHKEIAYQLGVTEGTSKSQLNLAKSKIKEMLEQNKNLEENGG